MSYIASSTAAIKQAQEACIRLERAGIRVMSTWHREPLDETVEADPHRRIVLANRCYREIRQSAALLLLAHPDMRGAIAEAGYALGIGCEVYAVGNAAEHTLMLAPVTWANSIEALIPRLRRARGRYAGGTT